MGESLTYALPPSSVSKWPSLVQTRVITVVDHAVHVVSREGRRKGLPPFRSEAIRKTFDRLLLEIVRTVR